MAARKKKEVVEGEEKQKFRGLFDHIDHVRTVQDPHYFDNLSEGDKKTWSNWMVNRFLSMTPEYIDMLNEIQHLGDVLTKEEYYRLLIMIIPKRSVFPKFIKGKASPYPKNVMTFLAKHYECSTREVEDYLNILTENDLKTIYYSYGYDQKQAKKFLEGDV